MDYRSAPRKYEFPLVAGRFYTPQTTAVAALATTPGNVSTSPFYIPAGNGINQLYFEITASGAVGSLVALGVYDSGPDGMPNNLLTSVTGIDGTQAPGVIVANLPATLAPNGVVWLAYLATVAAPTVRVMSNLPNGLFTNIRHATALTAAAASTGVFRTGQAALPAQFGTPDNIGTNSVRIGVRAT